MSAHPNLERLTMRTNVNTLKGKTIAFAASGGLDS
jgi:hypothetical protein